MNVDTPNTSTGQDYQSTFTLRRKPRRIISRFAPLSLVILALLLTGCIPEPAFVDLASCIALDPSKTCEWLKVVFGVPELEPVDNPGQADMVYEETQVTTAAGETLRVWYVRSPENRGTIVFSNGGVGEMACYLLITKTLYDEGWSFVMYDYQGFGGSTGRPELDSLYGDLDAVLDWTLANTDAEQVTLMGVSGGSIPSVAHAAAQPEFVNAVILDGVISLRAEIERFSYLCAGRPERYYTLFDDETRLQVQIQQVTQPILAVVYGQDEYATSAHVPGILALSPAPATILEFPDLPHARGPYHEPDRYFENVKAFLDSIWPTQP
ncbi:MAG: alpha/beta fold hydrolase [Planctomycetota bacterium]